MTGVKICGLRRKEDIEYVNCYLPHYIGLVFAKSKRQVSKELAADLRAELASDIKAVGVFVNEDALEVAEITRYCGLDCIQLHGDESPEYIESLKEALHGENIKRVEIWKAVRVRDEESVKSMSLYDVDAFLLDTYVEGSFGGAGKTFDWELACLAKKYGKIILAGGLDTGNVSGAVGMVRPFAVDVSSGVETDGFKDEVKISSFIKEVKSVDDFMAQAVK
ncbi:MAG: phosphoribosylanthranilate isomerase [Bacillota bacterium]